MKHSLTFIVSTNQRNFLFTLPFIYFASKYNLNSIFDVHLFECNPNTLKNGFLFLKNECNITNINVQYISNKKCFPQQYRFLVDPIISTKYTYCSDIDIMICEDILPFHIHKLNDTYLYDNEIRAYNNCNDRMSGLHFATDKWYAQTKQSRSKYLKQNIKNILDEILLKQIAIESHVDLIPTKANYKLFNENRPVHGQHISLSRYPFNTKCSMKCIINPTYSNEFTKTLYSTQFAELLKYCPTETKQTFNSYLRYVKLQPLS